MIHLIKGILVPFCCFAVLFTAKAQETHNVNLLDKETMMPIVGATYEYGSQNGVSNAMGTISFYFKEGKSMQFSHVGYGKWALNENEVRAMLSDGVLYRQEDFVNLYPVTVLALRLNEKPTDKIKLDYQEQLAHDATTILNQNPAVNSIRKGGNYGFDPVIRGFKYDQLNIVLNGAQSATAACPNRMDPPTSQMAPNMLDRIEILKGPHALRFGTGFGATINFIPTKLRFSETTDTYGRVSSGYEGNGNVFRNEGKLGFSGKSHDLTFFGSWSQGDDYEAGNGRTIAADFKRGSFGTNVGLRLSENNQLRLSAIYNVARDADFPALPMDLREDDTWLFNARHDITFEEGTLASWNTTAFASFVDHLMDNLLRPEAGRMSNNQTNANTFNYGGRTEGLWKFDNSKLFAGADLRVEGADGIRERSFFAGPNAGNTLSDNAWQDGVISKGGFFAEYHVKNKKTQYVFSTRLELNNSALDAATSEFIAANGDDTSVTQFNPSFSLGARRPLSNTTTLGIWLGRAQRSGGLTERFINYFPVGLDPFELLGNPQLDPEVNNQLDVTFEWNTTHSKINIDLFAGYLQDFITSFIDEDLDPRLPMSPGVRRFINIDDAFKTGFEISWSQQLYSNLRHQMGIAYTYAQDLDRDQPLPEIAPLDFRYTLIGSYLDGKLQPELSFRHVLEQARVSPEFGETESPAFTLLDVTMSYQLTKEAKLTAGVNNLFDESYNEHLNRSVRGTNLPILATGRNAFASVNFVF